MGCGEWDAAAAARTGGPGSGRAASQTLRSVALLALVTLLFCAEPLTSHKVYYYGDIAHAHFAFHAEVARQVRAGWLPLWTDRIFGGFPLLAEGQAGVYYPPNILYYLPGLPLTAALKLSVSLHFFLAGLFTFLLAGRVGLSLWPARLAALVFAFSGYMATRLIHQNVHHAAVWLPLALYFVTLAREPRGAASRLSFLLLGAAAIGVQALAFYPPLTFYTLIAVVTWCLWPTRTADDRSLRRHPATGDDPSRERAPQASGVRGPGSGAHGAIGRRVPSRHAVATRLAAVLIVAGTGLALAAAQVLPTLELLANSARGAAGGYDYVTAYSLPLKHLATLLLPNVFGSPATDDYWGAPNHWELCGYVGVLPLVLALVAIVTARRSPAQGYFAALALFGLVMALGSANPFYRLVPYLPGFNLFKAPARYLYLSTVGLAMLSGLGLQALLVGQGATRARRLLAAGALAGGALSGGAAMGGFILAPRLRELAAARVLPQLAGAEGRTRPEAYYVEQFVRKWGSFFAHRLEDLALLALLGVLVGLLLRYSCVSRRDPSPAAPAWLALSLTLVAALELFRFGANYNPLIDPSYYSSPPALARAIAADQEASARDNHAPSASGRPASVVVGQLAEIAPARAWRVGTDGWERDLRAGHSGWAGPQGFEFRLREALPWNLNLFDATGLRLLDGGTALPPEGAETLQSRLGAAVARPGSRDARRAVAELGALNVGYVVSPLDLTSLGCVRVAATAGLGLYRVPGARPRVFLAPAGRAGGTPGPPPDTAGLKRRGGQNVPPPAAAAPIQLGESARLVTTAVSDPARVDIETVCSQPRLLVLNERPFPGWGCRVDGERSPLVRAGPVAMAVRVPPGRHRVQFRYQPASTRIGQFVSLATLSAMLVACVAVQRASRRAARIGPR